MGGLNFSHRKVSGALTGKLGLDYRGGKERNAWYIIDGVQVLRITAPKVHSGDIPPGTLGSIRNQTRLSTRQFQDLVNCPMSGADYEAFIRDKIAKGEL